MFLSIKTTLAAMLIGAASFATSTAKAQDLSAMDMRPITMMNQEFDNQFYAMLPGLCMQIAHENHGQPLPFNAMTIFAANNALSQSYANYNAGWATNSAIQSNAVNNWTMNAIDGNSVYTNPSTGSGYILPNSPASYFLQNGQLHPGYQQGGTNFLPKP